ncbi:MAG: hypothetical protein N2Z61_00395 [Tepidimonas fonticaldi]|nr:hypothetical protein [Tepidimonas fonticaldi]
MQVISFTRRKSAAHARSAHVRRSKEKAPAAATAQGIQQKNQWSDCPMLATRNTWQRIRSLYKAMHLAAAAGDVSAYKQAYDEWRALLPEVREDLDRIDDSRLRVAELSAFGLYPVPAGSATPDEQRTRGVSFEDVRPAVSAWRTQKVG